MLKGGDTLSIIPAGLPDIAGEIIGNRGGWLDDTAKGYGAIKLIKGGEEYQVGGGNPRWNLQFKASYSNKIYGNSETIQPPALSLMLQIRF